jgi:hypothetical protein
MSLTRAARSRSSIYQVGDGFLFVPAEEMWNLHEASKPAAILARAGLGRSDFRQWLQKHGAELALWLYSYRAGPDTADGFEPTDSMVAFRKEATIRAILAAAPRSCEQMQEAWRPDRKAHVTEALLSYWRRMYKSHEWFDRWLLRGAEPPPAVTVVTAQQANRCNRAWDFSTICRRIGVRTDSTYVLWLSQGQIPSEGWLKWLFGAPPPPGSFVVDPGLQRLRREMGRKALLRAAGLNTSTIWQWDRNPRTRGAIRAVLEQSDPSAVAEWGELPEGTRDNMLVVRKVADLRACCERAAISVAKYYKLMAQARLAGVEGELTQYLRMKGLYAPPMSRQSGLIADNFFIPTADMVKFREEAMREGARQQVWSLQNLPGFNAWFRDWTTPKGHRGRRHTLPAGVESTRAVPTATVSNASVPVDNKATTDTNDAAPRLGGRPRSASTDAVYRFCYENHGKMKRDVIRLRAQKRFGDGAPKEPPNVTLFARRYAKAHNLPFPPRR